MEQRKDNFKITRIVEEKMGGKLIDKTTPESSFLLGWWWWRNTESKH